MTYRVRIFTVFFLSWFTALSAWSAAAQSVVWTRTDFAPYFILEGDFAGRGIADRVIKLFRQQIINHQHSEEAMSLKRVLRSAREGQPFCHVALLKTPQREKFIEYSKPYMMNYANGLLTIKRGLLEMGLDKDDPKGANFAVLAERPDITISVHDGRSYSPMIDDVIARNLASEAGALRLKTGKKEMTRLFRMMQIGRLDAIVARPEEGFFYAEEAKLNESLYFLNVANDVRYSYGRVGCAKGEWNDDLLAQINKLIESPDFLKQVIAIYADWIPEHLRSSYRQEALKGLSQF